MCGVFTQLEVTRRLTGASFSMQPEKVANYIFFNITEVPSSWGTYIFANGTPAIRGEQISTGSNAVSKTYSFFSHTLKKGKRIDIECSLTEDKMGANYINATFYNFKLDFKVIE